MTDRERKLNLLFGAFLALLVPIGVALFVYFFGGYEWVSHPTIGYYFWW
jgi:hypothetical protein